MEQGHMNSTTIQTMAAIFVALAESSGTLPRARRILSDALDDGVITDPIARDFIECIAEGSRRALPR